MNGAGVKNPGGSLTIKGSAHGAKIAGVDVAIEANGSSGQWWDGQTGTWTTGFFDNAAVVANPGASYTKWSYSLPVTPAGGSFRVLASSSQANGLADVTELTPNPGSTNVTFNVRNAPGTPHVYAASGDWVAPGATLSVSGSGFAPSETVTFSLEGVSLGTAVASTTGTLTAAPVKVPLNAAFGPSGVVVTGKTSGSTGTVGIDVSNSWTEAGYNASQAGFEPYDPLLGRTPAPGPPNFLSPVWSDPTGAAVRTSMAVSKDVGYFGNDEGDVYAVNVQNGQPLWTVTESSGVDSSPALAGTRLFFGTEGGTGVTPAVVALDQATGTPLWTAPTSSAVESAPAVAPGHVFVGSDDGTVYALTQSTGAVIWTAKLPGAVKGSPSVDTAAGVVVVGDASGDITALSYKTGAVVWQVTTGGPVSASASIFNGIVYVGSGDDNVYALSETTGSQVWVTPTTGPVTATGVIYAYNGDGHPYAPPTYYAVGSQDGTVRLLDLSDGLVNVVTVVGGPVVGLTGSVGWLTVTSSNGAMWGLKRHAEPIWKTVAAAPYATAATEVNGIVYTSGEDQTVTAWSIPGRSIP